LVGFDQKESERNIIMQRYNKIREKNVREILLLKSLPCVFGKCTFCNYILDNSTDLDEIDRVNTEVLASIDGEFGVVEIINSGSVFELPRSTLEAIRDKVDEHKVHTLYFEVYYGYHKRLSEMREFFPNQEIRYCIGIETFDDNFRKKVLHKAFSTKNIADFSEKFYACNFLICIEGQTREGILKDISIARDNFKAMVINVFVNNITPVKRDEALVEWLLSEVYPDIKDEKQMDILIDNKDFGVYVQ
jgi:biotin synthase-like enzyme